MNATRNTTTNTLNKNTIALNKLDAVVFDGTILDAGITEKTKIYTAPIDNFVAALTLNAELMNLGFIMSAQLLNTAKTLSEVQLTRLAQELIPPLQKRKGSHVNYQPMYPNFPEQMIDASDVELYFNAIRHYWSAGQWTPNYRALPRAYAFEANKFIEIGLTTNTEINAIFTKLLQSNDSIAEDDKQTLEWFMLNVDNTQLIFPGDIPFAENKCIIAAILLAQDKDISPLVKTATDILRIATYLSEGDVSLAQNVQYVSLPRSLRKTLTLQLARVINEEDIGRHRNKWVRLFHNLHVGEYSEKVYAIAKKARNNQALESFYGRVEYAINTNNLPAAINLLKSRPGEFGRKLDLLLRLTPQKKGNRLQRLMQKADNGTQPNFQQNHIVDAFLSIADKIPTRNLLQLLGHLHRRNLDIDKRVVFPKGNTQRAIIVRKNMKALNKDTLATLIVGIKHTLTKRFSEEAPLGKVWIDPDLMDCPVPSQQRSASKGLFSVARGTRLPIGDDNTLRLFVYWVGRDIDLSASFHNEDFSLMEQVSYTNLRSRGYQTYHSGDITSAPNGACEFIDITIDAAVERGARYLAMNVLVYCGPTFSEHDTCFAGWMTRSTPNSNEVFSPKSVQQKIDIRANGHNVIPVIFDLKLRKAIWTDICLPKHSQWSGNNIESNRASIEERIEAIVDSTHKLSLYELFEMHAAARGNIVTTREEADQEFSISKGVTPFHIDDINCEYIG